MKKLFICMFIVLVSIFTFNLNVYAEEIDTENTNLINEIESSEVIEDNDVTNEEQEELISNEEIVIQHTKVSISKVNEKGEQLAGAKLQILDLDSKVLYEWISDGTVHEVTLSAGKYILHEAEAPEGYLLAADKEFEVEVILDEEIIGDADMAKVPCDHGGDSSSPMYYIEIDGISYEVYCINQGLNTPNGIDYNGQILTPEEIRNFTLQETDIDGEGFTISGNRINVNTETIPDFDVSDQTLTNQELYDKVLDIIYHRYLAEKDERFKDLSIAEIRFITEIALKNYLNARITTYETVRTLNGTTISHTSYNVNGEVWEDGDGDKYIKLYNKFYNKEYNYDPNSPTGYVINSGNGDSLGNFAKHWYHYHNKTQMPKIYADLFYFLINNEISHPTTMQIFIYSPTAFFSEGTYQNLLGITGYIEDANTKEQYVEMKDQYSNEKRDIPVVKIWKDENAKENRPESVKVNLYADGVLVDTIELTEENNWSYIFKGLDMYKEGKKIIYTIEEVQVPEYESKIEGDMEPGFTIINTPYGKGSIEPPEKNNINNLIVNPETSSNAHNSILIIITSIIGLLSLTLYIKKLN